MTGYDTEVCNFCKEFGHTKHKCPQLLDRQCSRCGERGHTAGYCPSSSSAHRSRPHRREDDYRAPRRSRSRSRERTRGREDARYSEPAHSSSSNHIHPDRMRQMGLPPVSRDRVPRSPRRRRSRSRSRSRERERAATPRDRFYNHGHAAKVAQHRAWLASQCAPPPEEPRPRRRTPERNDWDRYSELAVRQARPRTYARQDEEPETSDYEYQPKTPDYPPPTESLSAFSQRRQGAAVAVAPTPAPAPGPSPWQDVTDTIRPNAWNDSLVVVEPEKQVAPALAAEQAAPALTAESLTFLLAATNDMFGPGGLGAVPAATDKSAQEEDADMYDPEKP